MLKWYWLHFAAWLRGDFLKITARFEKAASDLLAHNSYLTAIADEQAQASRALASRAESNYQEADKANKVAANLRALLEK